MAMRRMRFACWISKCVHTHTHTHTHSRTHTHTHTHTVCNTYFFSIARMVARTRLSVTLYYVHFLSCLVSISSTSTRENRNLPYCHRTVRRALLFEWLPALCGSVYGFCCSWSGVWFNCIGYRIRSVASRMNGEKCNILWHTVLILDST